jgi:hypothetical protein
MTIKHGKLMQELGFPSEVHYYPELQMLVVRFTLPEIYLLVGVSDAMVISMATALKRGDFYETPLCRDYCVKNAFARLLGMPRDPGELV